ncbi:MAG: hypothetical protein ACK502_02870 [Alphaproteobacteria bacterium]
MKSTDLRNSLKGILYPYLESKGFTRDKQLSSLDVVFRKTHGDKLYICEIRWDKYQRPAFTISTGYGNITSAMTKWGYASPADIIANSLEYHCSLNSGTGAFCHWFTQKNSLWQRILLKGKYRSADEVVSQCMSLFKEIEIFWESGTLGPHCHTIPTNR